MAGVTMMGLLTGGLQSASASTSISVLYAGSMTQTMEKKVGPDFQKATGVMYQGEGAGSSALAQMIRGGLKNPDIFISASPSVNKLLMGKTNKNLVSWYMTFAKDELVIAYSPKSRFVSELDNAARGKTAWYKVLEDKGFLLGRTDPKLDPKGAYTVLMTELAVKYYHQPSLEQQVIGSVENTAQVYPEETLLARLSTGQIDAVVAYKHEALEWGVPYIALPKQINLGDSSEAKLYSTVSVQTAPGKTTKGAPIIFTVTIPNNAKNKNAAESFVRYIVSGAGHKLLMNDGFTSIPAYVGGSEQSVPKSLQSLIAGEFQ